MRAGADHVQGLELSRRLYVDAVRPLLSRRFPGVAHAAALIGPGSEVLGFDTERSTDHDWGPRLQLFLSAGDVHGDQIRDALAEYLPASIAGYPTSLVPVGEGATRHMRQTTGRVEHAVVVTELGAWLTGRLGFDPLAGLTTLDWLATPTQWLAEVTAGAVYHDGLGDLSRVRGLLAWYPDDLWRYVLACQWQRVAQEEAFVGRCGEVGDELGSAVVAARLARDLMRLCLLIRRRYPPYSKWLGTAFAGLPGVKPLQVALTGALTAANWHVREHHLVTAYEIVARWHNDTGLAEPLDPRVRRFHDRPFRVLQSERFVHALRDGITDPSVRTLPLTGAVDQFADSTDVIPHGRTITAALYGL